MEMLRWRDRPSALRDPVLVAAFEGWNDAGASASMALSFVARQLDAVVIGEIDCEQFYDFQENRPTIDLSQGAAASTLTWPDVSISLARAPSRDIVIVRGAEPTLRWRTFTAVLAEVIDTAGAGLVVTLGSLLSDQTHSRPVVLTGIASPESLLRGVDTRAPSYTGPTGIVGVLHHDCVERHVASASLWAPVPHYAAGVPNPKGALALATGLAAVTGVAFDLSEIEAAAEEHERQLTDAVARDPRLRALVEHLEDADEDDPSMDVGELPTGEDLAAELERFLREREEGDPPSS